MIILVATVTVAIACCCVFKLCPKCVFETMILVVCDSGPVQLLFEDRVHTSITSGPSPYYRGVLSFRVFILQVHVAGLY